MNKWDEIKEGMNKVRSGWLNRGIGSDIGETIWQHSQKVAKATDIYIQHFESLDRARAVKMAEIHDIAEYKEKDYIPGEIDEIEKHEREKKIILELEHELGEEGVLIRDLWFEYEAGVSQEAVIVKQLDKLDAVIQALEYEKLGYDVSEFYGYILSKLKDPILLQILNILLERKFVDINSYDQYFLLLKLNGDRKLFEENIMSMRLK